MRLDFRVATLGAILASACQSATADFDDSRPPVPVTGISGGGASHAGSGPGSGAGGQSPSGGVGAGGLARGGESGTPSAGKTTLEAGQGGVAAAEEAGAGGALVESAGVGGAADLPPIAVQIDDFEDAYVTSCNPNESYGKVARIIVDRDQVGADTCVHEGLLQPALTAIPAGAKVSAATLTLYCLSGGDEVSFAYVDDAWDDASVRWTNRPGAGDAIGTLTCAAEGPLKLDVTQPLVAWVAGQRENHGWYLTVSGSNGTDFSSSEAAQTGEHPRLSVNYTLR